MNRRFGVPTSLLCEGRPYVFSPLRIGGILDANATDCRVSAVQAPKKGATKSGPCLLTEMPM